MEPQPSIEVSSPSAAPIHERIASLETLRQEYLLAAAEIEKEVARLHKLLIVDDTTTNDETSDCVARDDTRQKPSLTFSSEVSYHDNLTHLADSKLEQVFTKPNAKSGLSVFIEPAPLHSPLPRANLMYAGHTPLVPGSPSPEQRSPTAETTPEQYLDGPLTLPIAPGDSSDDGISLRALGERLADIARKRSIDSLEDKGRVVKTQIEVDVVVDEVVADKLEATADKAVIDKIISDKPIIGKTEFLDGIRMKMPQMNMGAPFGQL